MTRKRSPKEIIESEPIDKGERSYVKFPGRELVSTTAHSEKERVSSNIFQTDSLFEEYKKPYSKIHTHPSWKHQIYPSKVDIYRFLQDPLARNLIIAPVDEENKKIKGYFILRKTKKTPLKPVEVREGSFSIDYPVKDYFIAYEEADRWKQNEKHLKGLAKRLNLQYRLVPAEGYEKYEEGIFRRIKGLRIKSRIISAIIGIALIGTSLFFLSSGVTGNAIGNLSKSSVSWIGIFLLIIGLLGCFLWVRARKKR